MTPGPASTLDRSPLGHDRIERSPSERRLQSTAVVFAIAVVLHGADHLRRGVDVVSATVRVAGGVQLLLGVITVVLVFRRHSRAPSAAIAVGFASAVGFAAAHLLPHWSSFSDAFVGSRVAPKVTVLSWVAALFEIGADVALAWAGLRVFTTNEVRR